MVGMEVHNIQYKKYYNLKITLFYRTVVLKYPAHKKIEVKVIKFRGTPLTAFTTVFFRKNLFLSLNFFPRGDIDYDMRRTV